MSPEPAAGPREGLVLLDKPSGVSSFEALAAVKRALRTPRVGHTGTLDRFASGLLVVLCGRLTRLAPLLGGAEKTYTARVRFGEQTDTLDSEGRVVASGEVPPRERLESAVARFLGEIEQVPPLYSAVHYQGERAYRLARRGQSPTLAPRRVFVHELALLAYEPPTADLLIRCSAGTYVRALARDLAAACDTCATVEALVRTEVGPFRLAEAVAPEAFSPPQHLLPPAMFLERIAGVALLTLEDSLAKDALRGVPPDRLDLGPWPPDARHRALLDREGRLLAVVEREPGGRLRYMAVLGEG